MSVDHHLRLLMPVLEQAASTPSRRSPVVRRGEGGLITWHLLDARVPPDCGGVGDYTALVADGLAAAGDIVHVWYPAAWTPQPGGIRRGPA